ncbi:hypothetical protein [Cupriavidus campinensis]
MASLDPSIILQGKPAQIENPLVLLAQGEQFRAAQTKNKLLDMQLQQEQRAVADQQALGELTRAAYDPNTGTIDPSKVRSGLAQAGNYGALTAFETKQLAQQKAQREADKARLESVMQNVALQGQLLGGVTDQATYDQARQHAAENGVDVSKLPPTYDPNMVSQLRARALTAAQQVEQEWKQKGYDQREQQFQQGQETTRRGQDIGAMNAEAGRQVTIRGQDMSDARSREALAQKAAVDKAPTEFQGKSAGYGARAEEADRLIRELEGKGSSAAVNTKAALGRVPLVGGALEIGANAALSSDSQRLEQAQRDFINAVLRQESGAAISQGEFDNARRQYFPQPLDKPEAIAQKAANRKLAIEGFKRSAGKAAFSAEGSKPKPSLADIFGN